MSWKRVLAVTSFLFVLGGTLALSQASDLDILMKAGRKAKELVTNTLPESRKLAGPLAAFRAGDALPIEECVRMRIQTDKTMTGADVSVTSPTRGEVKLRGIVQTSEQKAKAIELASSTTGVANVVEELAVPEGK